MTEISEQLRELLYVAPVAIFAGDDEGIVTAWNPAAERMFGWAVADVIGGQNPIWPPHLRADVARVRERVFAGKSFENIERRVLRGDGTSVDVLYFAAPLRRRAGDAVFAAVELVIDLTQLKRLEQALQQSTERLRRLMDESPLAVVAVDERGLITAWNPAAERIFGWTADEAIGSAYPLVPAEKVEEYHRILDDVRNGRSAASIETQRRRKDGTCIDVRVSTAPLRDSRGVVVGTLGILNDITQWKQVQRERKTLELQLQQSQRMEAIGQLAGGIAHDINNLLTAMLGYAGLVLATMEADHPIASDVEEIKRAAERAASLTQQLLAFSRTQVLQPKVIVLNAVIGNVDKLLRRVIGEDIRLVLDLAEDLGAVKADPGQVEQVLMNLAVNARDAMPEGGTLTIRTANTTSDEQYVRRHVGAVPGRYAMIEVSDTGCGMTADVRARIFEPFFTTKGPGKGTGLGLSTVYGIVQQSGGYVWVTSEEGKGTTLEIHLPRTDEPLPDACQ